MSLLHAIFTMLTSWCDSGVRAAAVVTMQLSSEEGEQALAKAGLAKEKTTQEATQEASTPLSSIQVSAKA